MKRNNEDTYKDEKKHEKIVKNINFMHKIENIHPLSINYLPYWKEIKRRCMEGFWHEGKWMPGPLYFYINICKIRLNKDRFSTTKIIGKPLLRDLEWEKAYVLMEARGFSGFKDDTDYTCYRDAKDADKLDDIELRVKLLTAPEEAKKNGKFKEYKDVRKYLRTIHSKNLGKPLFQNNAWNVIDLEARGGGKSYSSANMQVNHTWLMDGLYDYDVYLEQLNNKELSSVEVMVGAIDGKYTKDLLDKALVSLDDLAGSQTLNGIYYPSPLYKKHTGSWYSGKMYIENKYEVKIGNEWHKKGTGSKIYNRSFKDDPFAGNGTRPSMVFIEEVGFFTILGDALGAMKDTTYNGSDKFGTIWMAGTGGENDRDAVAQVKEVFTDPISYDCLSFDDIWEESGDIGFFVPYEMTLNQYKDEEGNTKLTEAQHFVETKRAPLLKGKSKKALYDEMMNNPIKPSEIFLAKDSNIFPVADLKAHVNWLKSHQTDPVIKGQYGMFDIDEDGKVIFKLDLNNSMRPCHYPMKKNDDTTGCWVIWEHPTYIDGAIPYGLYLAGTDPYDQDKAPNSVSLGSTFIYKTFMIGDGLYDFIVAEYTARPDTAVQHHEQVRRGLMYFNARDLYENERNTMKFHFEHKNSLYLLTKTPTILKSTENSNVQRGYGTHMTDDIKDEIEVFTRDWLQSSRGDGKLSLQTINSIPLLEELIAYNRKGNFDRVIAFMLVILNKLNNHRIKVEAVKQDALLADDFFERFSKGKFYN